MEVSSIQNVGKMREVCRSSRNGGGAPVGSVSVQVWVIRGHCCLDLFHVKAVLKPQLLYLVDSAGTRWGPASHISPGLRPTKRGPKEVQSPCPHAHLRVPHHPLILPCCGLPPCTLCLIKMLLLLETPGKSLCLTVESSYLTGLHSFRRLSRSEMSLRYTVRPASWLCTWPWKGNISLLISCIHQSHYAKFELS